MTFRSHGAAHMMRCRCKRLPRTIKILTFTNCLVSFMTMTISEMGRKGGKARLKTMTAKQRSDQARAAVAVRWAKKRKAKK
jgi:hypothetical protein